MSNQEQTIQRYLLGELTEAEREVLEREYFTDRRLFEQFVQIENELVDKYARGLLSAAARERFENYYSAQPERRERARFAEALDAKLSQKEVEVVSTPTRAWFERVSALLRGPKLAWSFSIAVLFALVAGWFFIETRRLRQELARIEADKVTREQREREHKQQIANEQQRADKLSQELDQLRSQQGVAAPSAPPSPQHKLGSRFATLVLTIDGTRSTDGGPQAILRIPAGTKQVRLQLNLRENNYSRYLVVVQSAGGDTIFMSQRLTPIDKRTGATLTLTVPARVLASGDYILALSGVSKTGEVEDVSKSLFWVERD